MFAGGADGIRLIGFKLFVGTWTVSGVCSNYCRKKYWLKEPRQMTMQRRIKTEDKDTYSDIPEDYHSDDEKTAEIIIAKQRNGPTGAIKLAFLEEYTRFENYTIRKEVV